jgi:PST family polysaccharide transporter
VPPTLATVVFIAGILMMFRLDREPHARVSRALWIPTVWMLIAGSRMISEWRVGAEIDSPDQYFEGSPIDRLVLTGLLAAAVAVLVPRARAAEVFLRRNAPILLFFAFCGASVIWSDYPGVSFKRWTKALGDVVMVMVVLTDPDPSAAIRRLFARTSFLLIPASVLLVKYYPEWGRGYDRWTWTPYYGGVAIGKNGLGYVCLIFGLASLWRLFDGGSRIAHGIVVAMALWLFWIADSATSFACFFIGGALLAITMLPGLARVPSTPHLVTGGIAVTVFTVVLLNAGTGLIASMGRDTTLTGRTELWETVLKMTVDPLPGRRIRELLAWEASRKSLGDLLVAPAAGPQRVSRDLPEPGLGRRTRDRDRDCLWIPQCGGPFPQRSGGRQPGPRDPGRCADLQPDRGGIQDDASRLDRVPARRLGASRVPVLPPMSMTPFDDNGTFHPVAPGAGLRRLAVRGAGFTVLGQSLGFVIQMVATVVLARLITPADFGLVIMVTTFSLLLVNFGLNGFTEVVLQREKMDARIASNLFWIAAGSGLLLTLAFAGAAPLVARFYGDARLIGVTRALSATILLTSLSVVHLALLRRAMRFAAVSTNDMAARAVAVAASILLAILGWGYWALVAAAIALPLATCAGAWLTCRWVPRAPARDPETLPMIRFALNVYGRFTANYLTWNMGSFLLGWRFGAAPLGFYKRAYDLFILPLNQLSSPLTNVAVSALSRLAHDPVQYRRYFLSALSTLAFIGMGIGAGLTLAGRDLILFLLGPGWEEAGPHLSRSSVRASASCCCYYTHGWIHLSIGRADRGFWWGLVEGRRHRRVHRDRASVGTRGDRRRLGRLPLAAHDSIAVVRGTTGLARYGVCHRSCLEVHRPRRDWPASSRQYWSGRFRSTSRLGPP